VKLARTINQYFVSPAQAGLSTAELVVHLDLAPKSGKMDSRFRGNDGKE
jgi:hypothetical protein